MGPQVQDTGEDKAEVGVNQNCASLGPGKTLLLLLRLKVRDIGAGGSLAWGRTKLALQMMKEERYRGPWSN